MVFPGLAIIFDHETLPPLYIGGGLHNPICNPRNNVPIRNDMFHNFVIVHAEQRKH